MPATATAPATMPARRACFREEAPDRPTVLARCVRGSRVRASRCRRSSSSSRSQRSGIVDLLGTQQLAQPLATSMEMDPDGRLRGAHPMRHLRDVEVAARGGARSRLAGSATRRRSASISPPSSGGAVSASVGAGPSPSLGSELLVRQPERRPVDPRDRVADRSRSRDRSCERLRHGFLRDVRAVHPCRRRAFGTPRSPLRGTTRRSRAPRWCARPPAGPPRSPARRTIEGPRASGVYLAIPIRTFIASPRSSAGNDRVPDFPGVLGLDTCRLRRPWTGIGSGRRRRRSACGSRPSGGGSATGS